MNEGSFIDKTESIESLSRIEVLSREEFESVVYPNGYVVEDGRFRTVQNGGVFTYFDPTDVVENPLRKVVYGNELPKFYALTKEGSVITGISELEQSSEDDSFLVIKHVSIDPVYQGKGYGRKLLEGVFAYAKKEGVSLQGSSRSEMGKDRLAHIFEELAEETGVTYVSAEDSLRHSGV